jgi:hypothetical protein
MTPVMTMTTAALGAGAGDETRQRITVVSGS